MRLAIPLLCLAFGLAHAGGPAGSAMPPADAASCDVELNVTDPDPNGLNVRAQPDAKAAVVAVIKPDGEWTTVHAVARQGDWLRIDRAETVDDAAKAGVRPALAHPGWVHVGKLGISELQTGEGTVLRDKPDRGAAVLLRVKADDAAPTRVLECRGRFIKVRHGAVTGWTDTWCNNERTTCS